MFRLITSRDNQIIKLIRSLHQRKYRNLRSEFLIEGQKIIEEALLAGQKLTTIIGSETFLSRWDKENIQQAELKQIVIYQVADRLFKEISQIENPQGILAVVSMQEYAWEDMFTSSRNPLLIVVDCIQDPGNLGTIIRTAAAAEASGIVLSKGTVDLYNDKTLRSTMGTIFNLPSKQGIEPQEVIFRCKERKLPIIIADPGGELLYFQWDFTQPTALVIGNENLGPTEAFREAADKTIKIPMPGKIESLNAAVAAGVLMFEMVKQLSTK